jgi:hypothetical protein
MAGMPSRPKPIYSVYEEEVDLQEPINDFVVALAERIDGLQDLHSSGDFTRLGEQCGELAEEALRLGYPMLASVARVAVEACRENKPETGEAVLMEMTELIQRIRQAHRGAA